MRSWVKVIIILFPLVLFAQSKGRISGVVVDVKTKEPLIGVNVLVKGTYYGASTGVNGEFIISGMNPGVFDVEASMIGYKVVLQTGIKVAPGITEYLEFNMEATALTLGEEIVVVGQKPLFDADETSSLSRLRSEEIANSNVSSVTDILAEQSGVTKHDNEIHIRGGRIDESMFVVDGMSVKDPLSGYSGNLYINAEAIQEIEVVTGGYNAEYGQAMSGVVNIKLKEGRDRYEGAIKYTSDNFGFSDKDFNHFYSDRFEFNLGGPALLFETIAKKFGLDLPGNLSIYINGYGKVVDGNLPTSERLYPHSNINSNIGISEDLAGNIMNFLAPRQNNDWHMLYKLTWSMTKGKKLSISKDVSVNINQGYFMPRAYSSTYFPYPYIQILENYNTITRETHLTNINWVHTLNTKSFYEVNIGRFLTLEHSAVQDLHWTEYKQRDDLDPINYNVTDQDGNIRITYGDEFYDTGFSSEWYDITSDNIRLDADWTYQTSKQQKIKAGIENTYTQIQVIDIDEPWVGTTGFGKNYDAYKAFTTFGAFYLQDRIIFKGMTVNIGMRYDYWFPGKYVEDAINNPNTVFIPDEARARFNNETLDVFGYKMKGRFSPRFGISHPVTDSDVLYFYYGHFSQLPTFQYVFAQLQATSQSTYQVFGNPNLDPKTTVQYEIGLKHRFSEDRVLEVKAYWKDMFDYETSQTISSSNPKYAHLRFNMYFNADYARARGIEMILRSRLLKNWYVDLNFNYSIVTGKSATPDANMLVQAGELSEKTLGENFMPWDRPVNLFSNIRYNHPTDWGFTIRLEYGSSRRYTRSITDSLRTVDGVPYYDGRRDDTNPYKYFSKYEPKLLKLFGLKDIYGRSTIDLKVFKSFKLGGFRIRTLLEIENLLQEAMPSRINPYTGKGYGPGEILPYYMIQSPNPNYDPSRIGKPRTVEFGIQVFF